HSAGVGTDGNGAAKKPAVAPALAAELEGVLPDRAGFKAAPELVDNAGDMVGVENLLPAVALHFLRIGAGVLEPAAVVPRDPADLVRHPDELGNVVGQRAEPLLTFARFGDLLGQLAGTLGHLDGQLTIAPRDAAHSRVVARSGQQYNERRAAAPEPPGAPPRRQNPDANARSLLIPQTPVVAPLDAEHILARRQRGIRDESVLTVRLDPLVLQAFQPVPIAVALGA